MMDLDNLTTTNRFKLLKILGGKCRICSLDKIKYLEVDHIYDDGEDERTKYGSSEKIYGWYLQHSDKAFRRLQPLCIGHHYEKHHPILIKLPIPKQFLTKEEVFMDVMKILEKEDKRPVEKSILIQELVKTQEFTKETSENYIGRYLQEFLIYESRKGHYNRMGE